MESFWKVTSEYTVLAEQWWHSRARRDIVAFRNPLEIWEENPSFLLCELLFLTWGLVSFRHGKYQKFERLEILAALAWNDVYRVYSYISIIIVFCLLVTHPRPVYDSFIIIVGTASLIKFLPFAI